MRLKDQVAIVTGGSRGIGRGIVKAFAAEGAKVAFTYKGNQSAAESLVTEVTQAGGIAKAYQGDVGVHDEAVKVVEAVEKEWGPVYCLVNNAGIIRDGLFVAMRQEEWDTVLQTNLGGTFNFCHALAIYPASRPRIRTRARRTMPPARERSIRSPAPWRLNWRAAA
jgi:3-oxoacyl-[acyl-carrier protein] reductase